jgi:hypothetical protein
MRFGNSALRTNPARVKLFYFLLFKALNPVANVGLALVDCAVVICPVLRVKQKSLA